MAQITIGESGRNYGLIFAIVAVVAISAPGYYHMWNYSQEIRELKTEIVNREFDKFPVIGDEIDSLNNTKNISIDKILEYEKQLQKMKKRMNDTNSDELSLEDALKIIRNEN